MIILSIDLGKDGAYSLFDNDTYISTVSWKYDESMLVCDNLKLVCEIISNLIEHSSGCIVVVERIHKSLAYQWCLYYDIRSILVRKKTKTKVRKDKKNYGFAAIAPIKVKSVVTGNRFAKKDQMKKSVSERSINVEGMNEHAIDSIAIGFAYLASKAGK